MSRFAFGTDLILALVLPVLGPIAQFFTTPGRRNDVVELTGVLLWPGVYCAVGAYLLGRAHDRLTVATEEFSHARARARRFWRLGKAALVVLAVFQATTVVAASVWHHGRRDHEVARVLYGGAALLYLVYALFSLLSAVQRQRAWRMVECGEQWEPDEGGGTYDDDDEDDDEDDHRP